MARLKEWRARQKPERLLLISGYDSEDESNYITREVTNETVLSLVTKVL